MTSMAFTTTQRTTMIRRRLWGLPPKAKAITVQQSKYAEHVDENFKEVRLAGTGKIIKVSQFRLRTWDAIQKQMGVCLSSDDYYVHHNSWGAGGIFFTLSVAWSPIWSSARIRMQAGTGDTIMLAKAVCPTYLKWAELARQLDLWVLIFRDVLRQPPKDQSAHMYAWITDIPEMLGEFPMGGPARIEYIQKVFRNEKI